MKSHITSRRDISDVRQALQEVLSISSHPGARLKPLLARWFAVHRREEFDERHYGFRRFSELLEGQPDLVQINRPSMGGDIVVSLRASQASLAREIATIPKSIWVAFTNPDKNRRRFLDPKTGEIRHYVEGSEKSVDRAVAELVSKADGLIEISPIDGETQLRWMKEFLETTPIGDRVKATLRPLLEQQYSGQLNASFTHSLGAHREAYRTTRQMWVRENIRTWATRNSVDEQIFEDAPPASCESEEAANVAFSEGAPLAERSRSRRLLLEVLDVLTEEEVRQILVTTTLGLALAAKRER